MKIRVLLFLVFVSLTAKLVGHAAVNISTPVKSKQFGAIRHDFQIDGNKAFVIEPEQSAAGRSWLWYAPTFFRQLPTREHDWIFTQLLDEGFHICGIDVGESYGSPTGVSIYSKLYDYVTSRYDLNEKACLMPQSRGGLMLYNWAAVNSERVQCITGIYTVCDIESYPGLEKAAGAYQMTPAELLVNLHKYNPIDLIEPLAKHKVPILHIHGNADKVVPLEANSKKLIARYKLLGGQGELIVIPHKGHEVVSEFFKNPAIINFILKHAKSSVESDL